MSDEELELEDLPEEEQERVKRMLVKLMEMGIGAVHGDEEDGEPDAIVDCNPLLSSCKSACCTFLFALTKKEADEGNIEHDPKRPFFIKIQEDGYCAHLDRDTLKCLIWAERPVRCRKYDCRQDPELKDAAWL
jgi:Fe-S-cluster containining protein